MKAAHHRTDGDPELARGFAVCELVEVDELEHVAECLRERIELALRRGRKRDRGLRRNEALRYGPRTGIHRERAESVLLATRAAVARDEDAEEDLIDPRTEVR